MFSRADVLLCPTLRKRAARVDVLSEDDTDAAGRISLEHLRLTRPVNYLGLPSLSFPAGADRNGIPIGLQLIGPPHGDTLLLTVGCALREQNPSVKPGRLLT